MGVVTKHEVTQYDGRPQFGDTPGKTFKGTLQGDAGQPVLKVGDFYVKGVLEADGPRELCMEGCKISSTVISLTRTSGGGSAYEFALSVANPAKSQAPFAGPERRMRSGVSPTGAERRVSRDFAPTPEQGRTQLSQFPADSQVGGETEGRRQNSQSPEFLEANRGVVGQSQPPDPGVSGPSANLASANPQYRGVAGQQNPNAPPPYRKA